jgi:FAD/FMN-containing dehydrogenase
MGAPLGRKHNVRVVVKSTGHDYQGRSIAPGALTIWIYHLQGLQTHTSFQPKGCDFIIEGSAVTAAGGTQMITLYEELDKINQTIVGGGAKTVGIGGYITGGGHSILAPRYGLGTDQVLEMEVVTPLGEIITANECQNQDLFWAMRGVGHDPYRPFTLSHTLLRVN